MLPNKDLLTPGPWKVKGNTVLDGTGKTIAVVFARNATAHAYWFAEIPSFVDFVDRNGAVIDRDDEIAGLMAQIKTLTQENSRLEATLELLESRGVEEK